MAVLQALGPWTNDTSYFEDLGYVLGNATIRNSVRHLSSQGHGGAYTWKMDDYFDAPPIVAGGRWLHFWGWNEDKRDVKLHFRLNGSDQAHVRLLASGYIQSGRGYTEIKTSGYYNPKVPHWFAIEMVAENSPNGLCRVYVDGNLMHESTGEDYQNQGNAGWNSWTIGDYNHAWAMGDILVTDANTGRLPEIYGAGQNPAADGTIVLTPTNPTGTNWANVVGVNDAQYNEGTVSPSEETYGVTTLPWSPTTVKVAQINARIEMSGALVNYQQVLDSGGTISRSTAYTPGAGGVMVSADGTNNRTWETDPNTSAAWTEAGLNAAKIGSRFSS